IELKERIASQIARHHLRQRFADDQADRLCMVALEQRPKCRLDSARRIFHRFALGWTDGFRLVHPLPEQLGVSALDLIDLKTLPQPLVNISEFVDSLGTNPEGLAYDLGCADDVFRRAAVKGS